VKVSRNKEDKMPRYIRIQLTEAQRQELHDTRAHHPKAYLRERAAAVLKVADGLLVQQVAENGLLKRHEPETVRGWIDHYLTDGLAGWKIKTGRGRKSKFSPSDTVRVAAGADRAAASQSASGGVEPQSLVAGRHSASGGSPA
jgi:hypothetical protein